MGKYVTQAIIIITVHQCMHALDIYILTLYTEAYVSLATNDYYARGALTLGHSLRLTNTTKRLVLLVTNAISSEMRYI